MNEEEVRRGGWTRTSLSGGSHLKRTVEMYEELGFEVYLEEVSPQECEGCTACYVEGDETIYRVYTRPKDVAAPS